MSKNIRKRLLIIGSLIAAVLLVIITVAVVINVNKPKHLIAIFDASAPGTDRAKEVLDFAADKKNGDGTAKIDLVINYSSMNSTRQQLADYLKYANAVGVQVVISLKDFLGPDDLDTDPQNRDLHIQQYGRTNDERVTKVVSQISNSPVSSAAVWGYYTSDELPKNPSGLEQWREPLINRYNQVKAIASDKQVLVSVERNPVDFLKEVKKGADHLMGDYYSFPADSELTNGPSDDIGEIARNMHEAAGPNSWMTIQAFSYYVSENKNGAVAPPNSNNGVPSVSDMVESARAALGGGVSNLAIFSYGYMSQIPDQDLAVKAAVRQIRALPEFG